jgi:hypothetical protein
MTDGETLLETVCRCTTDDGGCSDETALAALYDYLLETAAAEEAEVRSDLCDVSLRYRLDGDDRLIVLFTGLFHEDGWPMRVGNLDVGFGEWFCRCWGFDLYLMGK